MNSTIPFWGQAWELVIRYQSSNGELIDKTISSSTNESEALRITFEVMKTNLNSPWWYADICVYNLAFVELQEAVYNAVRVQLSAGFQAGACKSSLICDLPVLQVLLDKENALDVKATFHCVANPIVMENLTYLSVGQQASQMDAVAKMAAQIELPSVSVENGTLSQYAQTALSTKQYPRGKTIFGKMGKYMQQIAEDQNLFTYRDGTQAYMTEMSAPDSGAPNPVYVYAPPNPPGVNRYYQSYPAGTTLSLIGSPRQTPEGVIFTVLLDPRLQLHIPPYIVQLVGTQIVQAVRDPNINGSGFTAQLDDNLTYFVGQVRHVGDSRGNEWYTEVTGYTTTYAANLLTEFYSAKSN